MPGRGGQRKRLSEAEVNTEDYAMKRQRNNDAVTRTRTKKRQEESETVQRVEELRAENTQLERKVEGLQKELSFLKEMFVAYASGDKKKGAAIASDAASTSAASSAAAAPIVTPAKTKLRRGSTIDKK
uniref:BZIP domain-containing protein n=1 Tax=Plectus sambesii TaxID=2011161 RepID=A0A914W4F6_9BILA